MSAFALPVYLARGCFSISTCFPPPGSRGFTSPIAVARISGVDEGKGAVAERPVATEAIAILNDFFVDRWGRRRATSDPPADRCFHR